MVLPPPEHPLSDFFPPSGAPTSKGFEIRFSEEVTRTQNYLLATAEDIQVAYPFKVTAEVEVGDPASMIADLARSTNADAIVMSTHGRSGLSRWLFGSVTLKVLEAAVCPVYVVPAKVREETKQSEALKAQPA
jgi:nucleotide-binding universal stress UspA family protein